MIKPIKTKKDYEVALKRLDEIFDAPINSKDGDEAEVLSLLIDSYENEKYPIGEPDPVEAIKIRMEEMGMNRTDLIGIIGEKGKVSEVLNRKRKLSLTMIRSLTAPFDFAEASALHHARSVVPGTHPGTVTIAASKTPVETTGIDLVYRPADLLDAWR